MARLEAFCSSIQSTMPPSSPTSVEALEVMTSLMRRPSDASALASRVNREPVCAK